MGFVYRTAYNPDPQIEFPEGAEHLLHTKLEARLLLLLVVIFIGGCGGMEKRSPLLSQDQMDLYLQSFDQVCEKIDSTYWEPEELGEEWEEAKIHWRQTLEAASTVRDARKAMRGLLKGLELSHFGIFPRNAAAGVGDGGDAETGAILRVGDGRAVVVKVKEGSPAQEAGLLPGEIVHSVGERQLGSLIETWLEVGNRYLPVQGLASAMLGSAGETRTYSVEDEHGEVRQLEIPLVVPVGKGQPVKLGHLGPVPLVLEDRLIDDEVLYMHFNIFLGPQYLMPWFQKAIQKNRDARGLIIDLRGNPGGLGLMACGIAGWLLETENLELGVMKMRDHDMHFVVNPRLDPWKKPVAVLIDEGSASTAEIFAQGLQDLQRARLFGRTTAGAALPSMIESLPCGDLLQYAIAGYRSMSGRVLEGDGVVPDEIILVDPDRIREEGDPALQAALRWIRTAASDELGVEQ